MLLGRNWGIVSTCFVLACSIFCSFLPLSHDSTTRLGLAQGQRPPAPAPAPGPGTGTAAQVGVLLDLQSAGGRASRASISLALQDFYLSQPGSPRISLHVVDCKGDEITAASAAIDLLKDYKVQAIIGPKTSTQARFIIGIGNQTNVPILSYSATSPYLSANPSKYFVRTALDDASQAPAIAFLIKLFGWRQVVPIYEDSDFGRGVIPSLVDALQNVDARIPYRSVIPSVPTDDQIKAEINRLKTMQTRVFIVHMSSDIAARLFFIAHEAEMLVDGYAWIVTDSVGNMFSSLDQKTINSMQGILGLRPYVPPSDKLLHFPARFVSQYLQENPGSPYPANPNVFQLWAYDTAWAIATALRRTGSLTLGFQTPSQQNNNSSNDLSMLSVSLDGSKLIDAIRSTRFQGISGDFALLNGQRQPFAFEIINVIGNSYQTAGFWTLKSGLSASLTAPSATGGLATVIWPGGSVLPPKGWEWPVTGKRLRIAVPVKPYPNPFTNVNKDETTGKFKVTGYCIDIFEAVMQEMPYAVPFIYVPVDVPGNISSSYSEISYQVSLKVYDAMVGDTTIVMNRSSYVDFTLPYTESGVQMVVPMKENWSKSFFIFVEPIENVLWAVILVVFVATGFVVWLVEHKRNRHFGGSALQQVFNISYFSFQAIIATPRDQKLKNWLSKFVLINLLLLVWLLEKLYSASLTSMMTARQLQPTIVDMNQLMRNGDYVGYPDGSFVKDLLISLKFDEHKIRKYSSPDQYAEALMRGSGNGGVAAIFDEIPYLKRFMSEHCSNHNIVGRVYKTGGFGFVFPKGSPLVADISRAILKVTEGDMIVGIERKWFGDQVACDSQRNVLGSAAVITFSSLRGVFLVTAAAWALALIFWAGIWFYQRRRGHDNDKQQSYGALAELAVEHMVAGSRDPDEHVFWTIGGDSHLVLRLRGRGNPPPQAAVSDEKPEPDQQPPAARAEAEEADMPLQERTVRQNGRLTRLNTV